MPRPFITVLIGLALSAGLMALCGLFWGQTMAKSLLFGGIVFSVPTLYFTLQAYRYHNPLQPGLMVSSFYRGQAGKFMLMAAGFAMVFSFVSPLNELALFVGYCLMIPAHTVIATFISKRYSDSHNT